MITTAIHNHCLTFSQLQDYALNKSGAMERQLQYLHISQCELCACAVNGFTAMPFTLAEVNAIHHQVTVKANAAHANPLIIARVTLAAIVVASVFAFYYFVESFSPKKVIALNEMPVMEQIIVPVVGEQPEVVSEEKKILKTPVVNFVSIPQTERTSMTMTELPSIRPALNSFTENNSETTRPAVYNSGVIYIYDLKVADYNGLYFNFQAHNFEIKGHTPPYKEGKESPDYLADEAEQSIPADKVLKAGLAHFSKEDYSKALEQFLLLRENNPEDQNALFYGGLCCLNMGRYTAAIRSFEEILKDEHSAFDEETKWNLALSYLNYGDRGKAYAIFNEIVSEKGFYAKKAGERLKSL